MAYRKSISLTHHEDQLLRDLHRQSGIPDGQFPQRQMFWAHFTETWNLLTDRDDSRTDLLHYIQCHRKRRTGDPKRWFTFGDDYQRLSSPETSTFSSEQWADISDLYARNGVGSDTFLMDDDLREEFALQVGELTGIYLPDLFLAAMLVARRKDGLLGTLDAGDGDGHDGPAFGDIDEVA